jgi:hypothetical protein
MGKYTAQFVVIQYITLDKHNPSVMSDTLTVPADHTYYGLVIDRTVPNGLNFQPLEVEFYVEIQISLDGGTTWQINGAGGPGPAGGLVFAYPSTPPWQTAAGITSGFGITPTGDFLARAVISTPTPLSPTYPLGIAGVFVVDSEAIPEWL